ncbi:MAG: hypothetical protein NT027_10410 [Proteobacteria bacterium]|nr:hypothetical protein [Pseudomonadota bacterium]
MKLYLLLQFGLTLILTSQNALAKDVWGRFFSLCDPENGQFIVRRESSSPTKGKEQEIVVSVDSSKKGRGRDPKKMALKHKSIECKLNVGIVKFSLGLLPLTPKIKSKCSFDYDVVSAITIDGINVANSLNWATCHWNRKIHSIEISTKTKSITFNVDEQSARSAQTISFETAMYESLPRLDGDVVLSNSKPEGALEKHILSKFHNRKEISVVSTRSNRWHILQGRSCGDCGAELALYAVKEKDLLLGLERKSKEYAMPGQVRDYASGKLIAHTRVFYGSCISNIQAALVFVGIENQDAKLKSFKNFVELSDEPSSLKPVPDSFQPEKLPQNCEEIQGVDRISSP